MKVMPRLSTLALLALSAAQVNGQVPATVARIVTLDTSTGRPLLEFENTGSKPLRAVVVRDIAGPNRGQVVRQLFSDPLPLDHTSRLEVWSDVDPAHVADQVEIAAVIFGDGTHLGSAPDRDGVDTVAKIFERWRGESDALQAWQKTFAKFPPDDHGFVQAFLAKAAALTVSQIAYSEYTSGVLPVEGGIKATAERLRADLQRGYHLSAGPNDPMNGVHDEASAHRYLVDWMNGRLIASQLQARDAGEAVLP
jgi:hypothetical protein